MNNTDQTQPTTPPSIQAQLAQLRARWKAEPEHRAEIEAEAKQLQRLRCYCGCGEPISMEDRLFPFTSQACLERYWEHQPPAARPEALRPKRTIEECIKRAKENAAALRKQREYRQAHPLSEYPTVGFNNK